MLKAVICDMDGTLGDTLPLCIESFQRIAEECTGRRPTADEVTAHFGKSDCGVLGALVGMHHDAAGLPIPRLVEIYESLHPQMAPAPFEGAVEMLRAVAAMGLRVGMITGKEGHTAAPTVRAFGMEGIFEFCGYGKPEGVSKHERLREVMELWQLQPDELIYVGDAPQDIIACHSVGVRIISAAWSPTCQGEATECERLKPEYRLNNFSDLLPLICQIKAQS